MREFEQWECHCLGFTAVPSPVTAGLDSLAPAETFDNAPEEMHAMEDTASAQVELEPVQDMRP